MVLGLLAIGAYYVWRLTVFAADVGGYWNIVTGKRPSPAHDLAESAAKAASSAASGASSILPTVRLTLLSLLSSLDLPPILTRSLVGVNKLIMYRVK